MKADFNTHKGTFLLYPTRLDVWRGKAQPIAETIVDLCELIARYEPVVLGVSPKVSLDAVRVKSPTTVCKRMEYDDVWIRDTGAIPCGDGLVAFGFNAWGGEEGLYKDWSLDQTVPEQMSEILQFPLKRVDLVLEGGNLHSNGNGTLIAVKNTMCNKNRNPGVSVAETERRLKDALGAEKVIFIDEGLVFDETGGHIDNLCAFADKKTLLLAWTDEPGNPQYEVVRKAYQTLTDATGANGEKFEIVKVPLPSIFHRTQADCEGIEIIQGSKERVLNEPIQPSYINFIFVNGGVIVPTFGDAYDEEAIAVFKRVFKDREVRTFPAREIVLGGGGMHCITRNY